MATKKTKLKAGDEVTLRATVTIPDGDERTGPNCVVVLISCASPKRHPRTSL
jgi:hypothetical protein